MGISETDEELQSRRKALISYMKSQMLAEDWHAVSDVANDLRELDREIKTRAECEIQRR